MTTPCIKSPTGQCQRTAPCARPCDPPVETLTSIELSQPVMMTPTLTNFPAGVMAYCDHPGHVLVRVGNEDHGMDTLTALRLLRDLRNAIEMSAGWPAP